MGNQHRGANAMKSALYLTLAYLAVALTLIIGAGFAVYDWRSK